MAIMIHQTDDGRVPGMEYLPCSAMAPKVGMALKLEGGQLVAAGGTDAPVYLSVTERKTACEAGELIPVIRILPDIVFEAPSPAGLTAKPGDKLQLASNGMGLSTGAGGGAEIVYTDAETTRFRFGTVAAMA